MKLIIKKDILLENLTNTSKAISTKNLIPILTGIKFDLKKDGLYLSASDSDISIRSFIPNEKISKVEDTGSIVIGGKYIVEIIRKLPDEEISIEVIDGYKMIISTSGTEFNLNGVNPNEFPNLDLDGTKNPIILKPELFKTIINQTFFATSQNESRPLLTGINFTIVGNLLNVIATDSYRLAKKSVVLEEAVENDINIVIPGKNLMELSRILDDDTEPMEMHIFNNKVLFKYKNILFLSRLLNGDYPSTANIIPNQFRVNVKCKYIDLYNMIDRASLLTSDRDKNTIKLELSEGNMTISSNSPEIGRVEEKMMVDSTDEITIAFSSKFMLDAIKSFNAEEVSLYMNNDSSSIIVKSDNDESLIQLVVPIKTY